MGVKCCAALTRYSFTATDNNWVENRIRPIALGRRNWFFACNLRAGKRAGCDENHPLVFAPTDN